MFSIGEFSRVTGLTIKTLRFYHEQGVLVPSVVNEETGYRYYAAAKVESARVITALRELGFSLAEITEILRAHNDESDLLDYLEKQRQAIDEKSRELRRIRQVLSTIIAHEHEARKAMQNATFQIEEKRLDTILIAGIRMKGKYSDCGPAFGKLGRRFGRHICGKAMLLCYDHEYRENDADFEVCMPIRKGTGDETISVRELPGGRCLSLVHQGPYEELGRSYAVLLSHIQEKKIELDTPCREVYIKGPGMIFRGNPKKYLTEIQMIIKN